MLFIREYLVNVLILSVSIVLIIAILTVLNDLCPILVIQRTHI